MRRCIYFKEKFVFTLIESVFSLQFIQFEPRNPPVPHVKHQTAPIYTARGMGDRTSPFTNNRGAGFNSGNNATAETIRQNKNRRNSGATSSNTSSSNYINLIGGGGGGVSSKDDSSSQGYYDNNNKSKDGGGGVCGGGSGSGQPKKKSVKRKKTSQSDKKSPTIVSCGCGHES